MVRVAMCALTGCYGGQVTLPFPRNKVAGESFVFQVCCGAPPVRASAKKNAQVGIPESAPAWCETEQVCGIRAWSTEMSTLPQKAM